MAKRRITKRIVDALGPGELVWDADCKGFGVRRQRDARIYVVKYRYLGGGRAGSPSAGTAAPGRRKLPACAPRPPWLTSPR